ncbi:hypothetical protein BC936DRAFT_141802 [Jimgerdemannia flammicorona]|uniref:Uncharacterized protein n=1 Tax=Jimgerdemannia flammicorona TaxID=994334 RepID=A0A433DFV3_9FUNG|nr:hypothetical protein BC936DRAFT_141802 [Jimgerdemannia flammicorona]
MYREKVVYASKFVPQCNRALRSFNLHFNRDESGQLSFYRRIPKRFQEEFNTYRQHYYARKRGHAHPAGGLNRPSTTPTPSASSVHHRGEETGLPIPRPRVSASLPVPGAERRKTAGGRIRKGKGKEREGGFLVSGKETEESGRDTDRAD